MKTYFHRLHITRNLRVVVALLCCALMLTQTPLVYAQDDKNRVIESINKGWPFYDPYATCDAGRTVSGAAADFLKKQSKLDPKWVEVIVKEANAAGADPIAMASLLFWENRKFPPYTNLQTGSEPVGLGPWQIIPATWKGHSKSLPANEQALYPNVYDPAVSTKVAAQIVKAYGGTVGAVIGSIDQDFSRGSNIPSMATVAKNYNAGQATWRNPSVAGWRADGRVWNDGTRGAWFAAKQEIIDDYILGMTYVYYQIVKGEQVRDFSTNENYAKMSLAHQAEMKTLKVDTGGAAGQPATSESTTSATCVGTNGAVGGDVVKTALNYAWESRGGHGPNEENAKPSYKTAMPQFNGSTGSLPFSDCGVFVATVLRASGAEPKYPKRGTVVQLPYIRSHPELFEVYDNINDTSLLKPGDVLIFDDYPRGHTYLYTGTYKGSDGKDYNSASASWMKHVPEAANAYFTQGGSHFTVARLKGTTATAPAEGATGPANNTGPVPQ